MRFFLYLLLAAPLIIAQDTSGTASDVLIPESSPTPSPTVTEPSSIEPPSTVPSPEPSRPLTAGEPCMTDDQCINRICDIYPPTGQRICLNGDGQSDGEECEVSRQCLSGKCDFSNAAPDSLRCVAAESSPVDTLTSTTPGPTNGTPTDNGGSSTTTPTPSSNNPTTNPGTNNNGQASVSDIVEVITSVSNGQSVRVTRTRAGASPSGRVTQPSGAASKLSSSGVMILAGLLAAFV